MPIPEVKQQLVSEIVGLLRKHGWQVGLEIVEAWLEEMAARVELSRNPLQLESPTIPVDAATDAVVG